MLLEAVQLPVAAKLTNNPELAIAPTVKSGSPNVLFPSPANVIVWFALSTLNHCGATVAAL